MSVKYTNIETIDNTWDFMKICIFGSGSNNINEKYLNEGFILGENIVKRGHSLVFGGGSNGMMGAVAKGAHCLDGDILAIIPQWMIEFEDLFNESGRVIYTDSMDERKKLFEENSDAYIITPGGIGTLDEFFEVMALKKLNITNNAIVILNIDNFFNPLLSLIEFMVDENVIPEDNLKIFHVVDNIDEALDYIEDYDAEHAEKYETHV